MPRKRKLRIHPSAHALFEKLAKLLTNYISLVDQAVDTIVCHFNSWASSVCAYIDKVRDSFFLIQIHIFTPKILFSFLSNAILQTWRTGVVTTMVSFFALYIPNFTFPYCFSSDSGNTVVTREVISPDFMISGGNITQPPFKCCTCPSQNCIYVCGYA